MTARRPYDPDEHGRGPSRPGPAESQPPEQRGYPPRGDVPTAGRRPSAGGPPPRPRPDPDDPRNTPPPSGRPDRGDDEPISASWSHDEKTRMVGKLGFVPPEIRGKENVDDFDPERVDPGDRAKFRKRKRAKKTPIWTKIGVGAAVVVLVAALGGGIYLLIPGEDDNGSGPAYEALNKPCDALDTAPMSKLIDGSKVIKQRNETDKRTHSARQDCGAMYGKPGEGGNVTIHSEVYKRQPGAKNAFNSAREDAKLASEDQTSMQSYKKVSGEHSGFAVQRSAGEGSETVDYELHYVHENVYLSVRASIYNGSASEKEAAQYASAMGDAYTQKWSEVQGS